MRAELGFRAHLGPWPTDDKFQKQIVSGKQGCRESWGSRGRFRETLKNNLQCYNVSVAATMIWFQRDSPSNAGPGSPRPKSFPGAHEPPVTSRGSPLCTLVPAASTEVGVREDAEPASLQPQERIYLHCLFFSSCIH